MAGHRVEIEVDVNTQTAVQNVNQLTEALQRLVRGGSGNVGGSGGGTTGATPPPSGGGSGGGENYYPYIQQRVQFYGQRALSFGLLMAGYSMKQFASYLDQLNAAVMQGATKFGAAMTKIVGVTNMPRAQQNQIEQRILNAPNFVPAYQAIQGVYPFATRNYPMKYAPEMAHAAGVLSFMTGSDAATIGNLLATALEQSTRNLSYQQRREYFEKDFKQLLDLLAYSWSKSPIEPQSVMKAATYAMPAMIAGGLETNEAYALFATMLGAVPSGGRVGRYSRTMLTNMVTMSPEEQTRLEQLTGLTAQQLDWTKNLSGALENIANALKNRPASEQIAIGKDIFGLRGLSSGIDLINNLKSLAMYIKQFQPSNVQGAFSKMEKKAESTDYGKYLQSQTQLTNALTSLKDTFMHTNTTFTEMESKLVGVFKAMPDYAKQSLLFTGKLTGVLGEFAQQVASLSLTIASLSFVLKTTKLGSLLGGIGGVGAGAALSGALGRGTAIGSIGGVIGSTALGWTIGQTIGNIIVDKMNSGPPSKMVPSVKTAITNYRPEEIKQFSQFASSQSATTTAVKEWVDALKESAAKGKRDMYLQSYKGKEYVVLGAKPTTALTTPEGKTIPYVNNNRVWAVELSGKSSEEVASAISGAMKLGLVTTTLSTMKGDTYSIHKTLEQVQKDTKKIVSNTASVAEAQGTSKLLNMLKGYMSDNKLSFTEITKLQAEMTKEHKSDLMFTPSMLGIKASTYKEPPLPFTPGSPIQYYRSPLSEKTSEVAKKYSGTHELTPQQEQAQNVSAGAPASKQLENSAFTIQHAANSLANAAKLLRETAPSVSVSFVGGF